MRRYRRRFNSEIEKFARLTSAVRRSFQNLARISHQVRCHIGELPALREVFSGRGGEDFPSAVFELGFYFKNFIAAIADEFRGRDGFFAGPEGIQKAHG